MNEGRIKLIKRAAQAEASKQIAELLMQNAYEAFHEEQDAEAAMWRRASRFVTGWGNNERECVAKLEKEFGRYDG